MSNNSVILLEYSITQKSSSLDKDEWILVRVWKRKLMWTFLWNKQIQIVALHYYLLIYVDSLTQKEISCVCICMCVFLSAGWRDVRMQHLFSGLRLIHTHTLPPTHTYLQHCTIIHNDKKIKLDLWGRQRWVSGQGCLLKMHQHSLHCA